MPSLPGIRFYGNARCGGAVVSPRWVITTASCADTADSLDHDKFRVVAGEWDLGAEEGTEQVQDRR